MAEEPRDPSQPGEWEPLGGAPPAPLRPFEPPQPSPPAAPQAPPEPETPAEPEEPAEPREPKPPKKRGGRPAVRQGLAAVGGGLLLGLIVLGITKSGDSGQGLPPTRTSPEVGRAIRGLSAAEKVDAVLLTGFEGTSAPQLPPTQGGVVITTANWGGLAAGKALISRIHAGAKGAPKPLVVGLQEGGPYRAYTDLPPAERELDIGDAGSASGAQAWATGWATALRSAGFDLDLSIIGDVATLDSPIADRAFSDETEVASTMTAAAVTGCTGAKLACAVAHFPGAGAESQDTDEGPATVSETTPELEQRDLGPFRAAISAGAPAIVLSNAFYAAYDPVTPASLTSEIATTLLREQLRYQGLAITDDLSSGAIRGGEGAAESAVRALAAGADMVYVSDPADAAAARTALLKAVQADAIPQERIDDAVGRVLELKRRQGLLPKG